MEYQKYLSCVKETLSALGGLVGLAAWTKIIIDECRLRKEKKLPAKMKVDRYALATNVGKVYSELRPAITEKFNLTTEAYKNKIVLHYSHKGVIKEEEAKEELAQISHLLAVNVCQVLDDYKAKISVGTDVFFEDVRKLTNDKLSGLMTDSAVSFLKEAADRDVMNPDNDEKRAARLTEFLSKIDDAYGTLIYELSNLLDSKIESTSVWTGKWKKP